MLKQSRTNRGNNGPLIAAVIAQLLMMSPVLCGQTNPTSSEKRAGTSFEVATIKPSNPNGGGVLGFVGYPGGRIIVGATTVKTLIHYAYNLEDFQVTGGPSWTDKDHFDVEARAPEQALVGAAARRATPNTSEREMLKNLLEKRFKLQFHRSMEEHSVYLLIKNGDTGQLQEAKDKTKDPRGGVVSRTDGQSDAQAFGQNASIAFLAKRISADLGRPVIDQTGLTGTYDFNIPPFEPSNHDMPSAIFDTMIKLGLKLKPGKAPVETFIIDSVDHPDPN